MDRKTQRQANIGSWRIPWTQWSLVRTQAVYKLEVSNELKGEIIKRQLVELGEPDDGTGISVTVGEACIHVGREVG